MQTLRYNDKKMVRGTDVKYLQARLNAHGAKLKEDGNFGPVTLAAVKAFQKAKGLTADGVVGAKTWAALNKAPFAGAPHFKKEELACKCGGKYCNGYHPSVPTGVTEPLLDLLEAIRAEANKRYGNGKEYGINVRSGYRCPTWNKKVGGAAGSQHKEAKAADISIACCTPYQLGLICDELNPNGGVGLGGTSIVHVDVRGKKSRWWYAYKSWSAWKKAFDK